VRAGHNVAVVATRPSPPVSGGPAGAAVADAGLAAAAAAAVPSDGTAFASGVEPHGAAGAA
jgi:hypothetical protein